MDEKRLAELLKDAVADTPPPTFTRDDITRESERQRMRHRNGLLAGSAFGVAVLAGATALGVALWTGQGSYPDTAVAGSSVSTGNELAAPDELPDEGRRADAPTERGGEDFPSESAKQGATPNGNGGPAGPTSTPSGCEQVDRELAAALAGELPAAANVKAVQAVPVTLTCGPGDSGAAFHVPGGTISVILTSANARAISDATPGSASATASTSDGREVLVVSEPGTAGEASPYQPELSRFAYEVAKIY